jgi:hypothetical protein
MGNNRNPGEKASLPADRRSLTRREWAQRMLAGAGAGMAAPALAGSHPIYGRLSPSPSPGPPQARAVPAEWKPAFFDHHQNQTLVALAERIVPGSTGAKVNRFLDTALGAETQERQQTFGTSLNALKGESLRRFTKSFIDLAEDQPDEILTAASTAQPSNPILVEGPTAETRPGARPSVPNLRAYFDHLKGWISMAYYSSEMGMKELGWTGENFFERFPIAGIRAAIPDRALP